MTMQKTDTRSRMALSCGFAILAVVLMVAVLRPSIALADAPLSWSPPTQLAHGTHPAEGLRAISCPTTGFCVAADESGNILWSTAPAGGAGGWHLSTVETFSTSFAGVSCPTTSFCLAVDTNSNIFSSTDPTGGASAWKVTAKDESGVPAGISCASASLCVVVDNQGDVLTSTEPTGPQSAWTATKVDGTGLRGISCPSSGLCVASDAAGSVVTSTEPTGGASKWHLANIDHSNTLGSVSCPTTTFCVVTELTSVLTSTNPTGGVAAWSEPASIATVFSGLTISCASATLCVAADFIGNVYTSTNPTGGSGAWTEGTVDPQTESTESAISCVPGSTWCALADGLGNVVINPEAAAGTWTTTHVDSAVVPNLLNTVSCASTTLCFATDAEGTVTFTIDPAGGASTWSVPVLADNDGLNDLSCIPGLCVGVDGGNGLVTSTEPTGNSSKWHFAEVVPNNLNGFIGISCPTTTLCVGTDYGDGSIITSTNPTGGTGAWTTTNINGEHGLGYPSCPTASFCVVNSTEGTILWSTNPTGGAGSWHLTHTALSEAYTVSCPTATLCVVAGSEGKVVTSTNPTGGAGAWSGAVVADSSGFGITTLACSHEGFCVGGDEFGDVTTSSNPFGGAGAWTTTNIVGGLPQFEESISGLACPSSDLCVAVDIYGNEMTGTPAGSSGAPVNSSPPSIAGTTTQGQALTETNGSWSNSPTSFAHEWQRCDSAGANCKTIPGATSTSYTLQAPDVGSTVRVSESASNSHGTGGSVVSAATAVVAAETTGGGGGGTPTTDGGVGAITIKTSGPGSGPPPPVVISSAQVSALLLSQLGPKGKAASIASLLKRGGLTMPFRALEPGVLLVQWYELSKGAKLAKARAKRVLVASGQVTFSTAGNANCKLKLTSAGKKLLKRSSHLQLTAKASFKPTDKAAVNTTKRFSLSRG